VFHLLSQVESVNVSNFCLQQLNKDRIMHCYMLVQLTVTHIMHDNLCQHPELCGNRVVPVGNGCNDHAENTA